MFLVFRMEPVASGRGLGDNGRVFFSVTKLRVKNWEVLTQKIYRFFLNYNRYIFAVPGLLDF